MNIGSLRTSFISIHASDIRVRRVSRRKIIRKRSAKLAFDALSIEGGLNLPEWLPKVAQLSKRTIGTVLDAATVA